jgi:hypothetical protein
MSLSEEVAALTPHFTIPRELSEVYWAYTGARFQCQIIEDHRWVWSPSLILSLVLYGYHSFLLFYIKSLCFIVVFMWHFCYVHPFCMYVSRLYNMIMPLTNLMMIQSMLWPELSLTHGYWASRLWSMWPCSKSSSQLVLYIIVCRPNSDSYWYCTTHSVSSNIESWELGLRLSLLYGTFQHNIKGGMYSSLGCFNTFESK